MLRRALTGVGRLPLLYRILVINILIVTLGALLGTWLTERLTESGQFTVLDYAFLVTTAVAFSALVNFVVLRAAFRPLLELQAIVKQVHQGNLRARAVLDRASDPDIGHFAQALNTMLERLEANALVIQRDKKLLESLAAQVLTAQEEERRRIARELHDEASQALTSVLIGLDRALQEMPPHLEEPREQVVSLKRITENTLEEIRGLIYDLRPTLLDDLGLAPALRWYSQNYSEKTGIKVSLLVKDLEERLPPPVETALYRIVQEALTNAVKHAQAREVVVRLGRADAGVTLAIQDDGEGFDVEQMKSSGNGPRGLGLFGIGERVALLGGDFEIDSAPGHGTRLTVRLSLSQDQDRQHG